MPADLISEILEFLDPAVCCSPEEVLQLFFCILFIVHVKDETELFLEQISSVQALVASCNGSKLDLLFVRQVLWCLAKRISGTFDLRSSCLGVMDGN